MTELDPADALAVERLRSLRPPEPSADLTTRAAQAALAPLSPGDLRTAFERFADEVYGYLLAFLGSESLAGEVLEETFFRIDRVLREGRGAGLGLADALGLARQSALEARRLLDKAKLPAEDDDAIVLAPATRALLLERTGLGLDDRALARARDCAPADVELLLRGAVRELNRALIPASHEDGEAMLELQTRWAAGLASPAEIERLEAHTVDCSVCRVQSERVRELCEVSLVSVEDSEASWDRIQARIERVRAHREAVARAQLKISLGCSFCHDTLPREESVYCAGCLAPHHDECFREHGRCSAPGCHETRSVRPGAEEPARPAAVAAPVAPPRRRRTWPWIGVGGVLVAAAAFSAGSSDLPTLQWEDDASQIVDITPIVSDELPPPVATYDGKTVDEWARQLHDYAPSVRDQASKALASMGSAAVPQLIRVLEEEDDGVRRAATTALEIMGAEAAPAVRALVANLPSGSAALRYETARALGGIGPEAAPAVPALTTALADDDASVRTEAAAALSKIGRAASPAREALTRCLADTDERVRRCAAEALGALGPDATSSVTALAGVLNDEAYHVRRAATRALGEIGPTAKPALQDLERRLYDSDSNVVAEAATAIGQIDPLPHVGAIIGAFRINSSNVTEAVIRVLLDVGPQATPKLLEGLANSDRYLSSGCWQALKRLGLKHPEVVKAALQAGRTSRSSSFRRNIESLLLQIDPLRDWSQELKSKTPADPSSSRKGLPFKRSPYYDGSSMETWLKRLRDRSDDYRKSAVEALGTMGQHPVPSLTAILADETQDDGVRAAAAQALGSIGGSASPKVQPALIEGIASGSTEVRLACVNALSSMGGFDQAALLPVISKVGAMDEDAGVRSAAAYALGKATQKADDAAQALGAMLADSDVEVRRRAVWGLRRLVGHTDVPATVLARVLSDSDREVRRCAAEALALCAQRQKDESGEFPEETREAMLALLANGSPQQRTDMAKALSYLGGPQVEAVLCKLLSSDIDSLVRAESAKALVVLVGDAAPSTAVLAALEQAVGDEQTHVREAVGEALTALGRTKPAEVGALLLRVSRASSRERLSALSSVAVSLDVHGAPALVSMLGRMKKQSLLERYLKRALIRLGARALPALLEGIAHKDDAGATAIGCADVLETLGVEAVSAIPALRAHVETWKRWEAESESREPVAELEVSAQLTKLIETLSKLETKSE